jgi:hypothetical protein
MRDVSQGCRPAYLHVALRDCLMKRVCPKEHEESRSLWQVHLLTSQWSDLRHLWKSRINVVVEAIHVTL